MSGRSKAQVEKIKLRIRQLYTEKPSVIAADVIEACGDVNNEVTALKYKRMVDQEMLAEMRANTKEDDLVLYLQVLQYLQSKAVEIYEDNHPKDRAKALALINQFSKDMIKLKIELGMHDRQPDVVELKISTKEKKALDSVFGGLHNNLKSIDEFKNILKDSRQKEAKQIPQKTGKTAKEKARDRIAKRKAVRETAKN